jgi:transposase-like protein
MRRKFTTQFKAQVARELLRDSKTLAEIGSEYEVGSSQLSEWKQTAVKLLLGFLVQPFRVTQQVSSLSDLVSEPQRYDSVIDVTNVCNAS